MVFQDQGDVIHAERMSLNMATQRGTIENGQVFMKTANFFMNGNEIEKTGESSYLVHNGRVHYLRLGSAFLDVQGERDRSDHGRIRDRLIDYLQHSWAKRCSTCPGAYSL